MSELCVLIWYVGLMQCSPNSPALCKVWEDSHSYAIYSSPVLCKAWEDSYGYAIYSSSETAMLAYDELFEKNKKKPFDYKLYKIDSEWLVEPKPKAVFYNLKLLRRQGGKP